MKNQNNIFFVGHSRFDQWSWGAICLLVVSFFFLPLYVGWGPLGVMLYLYLGLCLILSFPLRLFMQTFNNLYLYREGIEIHKPFRPTQFLFWDEIDQIRGSVWSSNLILSNRRGNISCRVNSSYTNYTVLFQLLLYARPDLFYSDQRLTLTTSPILVIFLVLDFVLLVIFGIHGVFAGRTGVYLLIMLVFCLIIFMGVLVLIPYSLSILGDQLVFSYPFRKKVLQASDVDYINKTTRFDLIYEWGEVTIHEQNGNVTLLMFYNLGVSLLYAFLFNWHQMALRFWPEAGNGLGSTPVHGHRLLSKNAPYLLPSKINAPKLL
jgi:hypothetical protein